MLFNKNTYRKTNDKKLLHKIGKRWVTVSIAMLALLGGSFAMKSVTTHASVVPNSRQQTVAVKTNLNQQLQQKPQLNNTNPNQNIKASGNNTNTIQSSATNLHDKLVANNIGKTNSVASGSTSSASNESASSSASKPKSLMLDAPTPSKPESTNSNVVNSGSSSVGQPSSVSASSALSSSASGNDMNTLDLGNSSQQAREWNFVQHGIRNTDYAPVNNSGSSSVNNSASGNQTASVSSPNAKTSKASAPINQTNQNSLNSLNAKLKDMGLLNNASSSASVASATAKKASSNSNAVKKPLLKDNAQPDYFSGKVTKTGNDLGLNYKVYANGGVEFTDGMANKDLSGFVNSDTVTASAIKFDNNINTSNVTNMSNMFNGDYALNPLNLGNNFDTSKVTNMSNMFCGDSRLQLLNLSNNFDTSKVTNMSDMFYGDSSLRSLVLPNSFDTSNVINMGSMFMSDSSLQSFSLPNSFNTSKVTNMSNMFEGDSDLQTLVLSSGCDTSHVVNASNMLGGDDNLSKIVIKSPNTKTLSSDITGLYYYNQDAGPEIFFYKQLNGKDSNGNYYTESSPHNFSKGQNNVGTFVRIINPAPSSDTATIKYMYNEQSVSSFTTDKQHFGNTTTASDLNHTPNGYQLITPNQKIMYNGLTYIVPVSPLHEATPYSVVYLNQNKTEVGQVTLSNLGYVSQTVNIEPQLVASIPQGYHLNNTNPINVTLNDGGIINVDTSNGVGANYHGLLGDMLRSTPDDTDNHVITVSGNPINFNGNVTLNFKANGKTIKTITKPYSVNTYTGDTVNLLNPSNYLDGSNLTDNNNNPITINNTYFTPDSNNNSESVTVQPSDAPQTSGNTKTNNSYVLNYNANNVNDNITYDLSGNNIPNNYQGQTGRMNGTSLNGIYDTNVPLSALNNDVPTNYHIVSGGNIRYDNGNHTVELAPDSENVNVTYTDQNGKTYVGSINGQYDQKINDITNNYNLPNGYHVNAGQDSSYTFNGNQNQSKTLNITGNTQNGNINVISKKYDGSTYEGEVTKTIHESGDTGNSFIINPADKQFTPDGYSSQSSQYNGTFTPTGLSTNTVTFNYKAGAGTAISVTYDNQHGANVGSGTITGNVDDKGSISSQVPVPNGYTVNNSQPSQYHILANSQNPITIQVTGKPVSELNGQGKFTITINKHIGSKVVPSTKIITVNGKVGDTFTVTPSNYTPTGYTSTTSPVQSSITPNGLAKNSATFDYTANTGDPINVTYINQANNKVGSGSYTGVVDQTGNITNDVKVPSDYTLNDGQDTNFTTTLNDQYITLKVTGKPANATIHFINQNGNSAGSENVSGEAGDTVSPSSYPKGYEAPSTPTKYTFNKSGQNPDEDNVRLIGKIAGDINNSKAKNAPKTATNGYVTVHVVERSTNGKLLHQFNTPVNENDKRVGDSYTVKPSNVIPSNYDVASGDNSISGVRILYMLVILNQSALPLRTKTDIILTFLLVN